MDQCVKDGAPPDYVVPSIFHTEADLIVANNATQESFYHFQNAANWFDVGMQVSETVKWRPDCLRTKEANLKLSLPPNILPRHPITVGSPTMCRWYTDEECGTLANKLAMATDKAEIQVTYGNFKNHLYIASCCVSTLHGTETRTEFIGTHDESFTPVYMREQTLVVALRQALKYMRRATGAKRNTIHGNLPRG